MIRDSGQRFNNRFHSNTAVKLLKFRWRFSGIFCYGSLRFQIQFLISIHRGQDILLQGIVGNKMILKNNSLNWSYRVAKQEEPLPEVFIISSMTHGSLLDNLQYYGVMLSPSVLIILNFASKKKICFCLLGYGGGL